MIYKAIKIRELGQKTSKRKDRKHALQRLTQMGCSYQLSDRRWADNKKTTLGLYFIDQDEAIAACLVLYKH